MINEKKVKETYLKYKNKIDRMDIEDDLEIWSLKNQLFEDSSFSLQEIERFSELEQRDHVDNVREAYLRYNKGENLEDLSEELNITDLGWHVPRINLALTAYKMFPGIGKSELSKHYGRHYNPFVYFNIKELKKMAGIPFRREKSTSTSDNALVMLTEKGRKSTRMHFLVDEGCEYSSYNIPPAILMENMGLMRFEDFLGKIKEHKTKNTLRSLVDRRILYVPEMTPENKPILEKLREYESPMIADLALEDILKDLGIPKGWVMEKKIQQLKEFDILEDYVKDRVNGYLINQNFLPGKKVDPIEDAQLKSNPSELSLDNILETVYESVSEKGYSKEKLESKAREAYHTVLNRLERY